MKGLLGGCLIGAVLSGCATERSEVEPVIWRNQPFNVAGDGVVRSLSGPELEHQGQRFGFSPFTLKAYRSWSLVVAPLQANGASFWRVQVHADAVLVCLDRHPPNHPVTQALQAPALLIGQVRFKPVQNLGPCQVP